MSGDSDLGFVYPTTIADSPTPQRILYARVESDAFLRFIEMSATEDPAFFHHQCGLEIPGIAFPGLVIPDEREQAFSSEKLFFETRTLAELRPYGGQYIAVYQQQIRDSDRDLHALTDRFFTKFGVVSVYITFVGDRPKEYLPSPVF